MIRPHPEMPRSRTLTIAPMICAVALGMAVTPPSDAPRAETPAPSVQQPDLGFDLLAPEENEQKPNPKIEAEVRQRRLMLQIHQGMGLATWTAMAATVALGQLELNDKYLGGGDTGAYRVPHAVAAFTTAGLFTATGLLGVLAPVPYPKKPKLDTITFHKIFQGIATAGMAAQIALGLWAVSQEGKLDQRTLAFAHQGVGYLTFAALTAGAVSLVF